MQPKLRAMVTFAFLLVPTIAVAQHDAHHDGAAAGQPSPPSAAAPSQQCAPMMGMHMPMMEAMQAKDPDVAFIKGMIPHHQAAIDMARAVLEYGSD